MFERLFRKQDLGLKLEQVSEYLDKEFSSQKEELEVKLRSYVQEIRDIFQQLEDAINLLSTKTSPATYTNTVKQRFCIKANEHIIVAKGFSGNNKEFIKTASESMRVIGEFKLKDFRHLQAFRDDMGKVAEKIRLLETRINYANKAITSTQTAKMDRINERLNTIKENKSSISNIEESLKKITASSSVLSNTLSETQQKMNVMNEEFSKYAEERVKLRGVEKAQGEIKQRLDSEFAGLGRVMKKFLYYGDLTKAETNVLQDYIKDPGTAFLSDSYNTIFSIIDKLYAYRDRKTIDMDESKYEKIKDLMRHKKILQGLRQKFQDLNEEKRQAE